jgi:cytochrome c biogenesis protein CcmG/thiol:disulfide interchange protein DsbE
MTRVRPISIAAVAALAALVGVLAYGLARQHDGRSLDQALREGRRPASPALRLPRLGAAGERALGDWRGRVVVLNFWASWCAPCREETPLLQRWQRRLAGRGGTVVGVDVLDVDSDALRFARKFGVTYPLLRDRDGSAARRFGVVGYPETVVLDRYGRVAAIARGPVDDAFRRRQIVPLLEERT